LRPCARTREAAPRATPILPSTFSALKMFTAGAI
jgi:hypothetical protein